MLEAKDHLQSRELEPRPESIALVGLTYFPSWYIEERKSWGDTEKVRGDLTLDFIVKGIAKGFNIVIADGGSSKAFVNEVTSAPITFVKRESPQRASGRRQGIEVASKLPGIKAIIRTETEKVDIVGANALRISQPLIDNTADIVIPKRNEKLFAASYRGYMHDSEVKANALLNKILHNYDNLSSDVNLDLFFGPIGIRNDPKILRLFMERYEFVGSKNWGARKFVNPEEFGDAYTFPVICALKEGYRVASVPVDFIYSPQQKKNEEIDDPQMLKSFLDKRRQQRFGIIDEAIHYIRYINGDPKSLLESIE